jgi:predicted N-acetyltransferase YhbS
VNLRIAVPADKAAIERVLAATFAEQLKGAYSEPVLSAALPAITRINPMLLDCGTYYVVESDEGRVVACGGWTPERPGTGELEAGLAHLRHFATDPEWGGRGIGRMIYVQCEEKARAAGARELECHSTLNAERFYAAMGFQSVSTFEVTMGEGVPFPAVIMRRPLED